jgi:DNA repair protein RecO (recombination protein O)
MSQLHKTNAIVLSKLNFGDTSKIVTLFTEEFGKETCIIKGGRSPKSKIGGIVDVMNHIQVVFYKKESREVQMISQADLISNFTVIKENLEKLKYASSVLELLNSLTIANEQNEKLYRGLIANFAVKVCMKKIKYSITTKRDLCVLIAEGTN